MKRKLRRGEYCLLDLKSAHPNHATMHRAKVTGAKALAWEPMKKLYGGRCACCGSVEGQRHLKNEHLVTTLEKGHCDPRRPLTDDNCIPMCKLCNMVYKDNAVLNRRGFVVQWLSAGNAEEPPQSIAEDEDEKSPKAAAVVRKRGAAVVVVVRRAPRKSVVAAAVTRRVPSRPPSPKSEASWASSSASDAAADAPIASIATIASTNSHTSPPSRGFPSLRGILWSACQLVYRACVDAVWQKKTIE